MVEDNTHIILFDGVCNLCNGTVQFLIKRDRKATFSFASLQSEAGQTLLKNFELSTGDYDSFIFIHRGKHYLKSTAALRVLKELGGVWKLFYIFMIVPKWIRDPLYSMVARNRYNWFGKRDSCMVPTPELRDRFL